MTQTKTCPDCGETKPTDQFWKNRTTSDGLTTYCRTCQGARNKRGDRFRNTGWSHEAFEAAWESQRGRCAICEVPMVKSGRKHNSVAADHCHETMKTRALLCSNCNQALGLMYDNTEALRRAADYLTEHGRR